ncbi:GTPase activating protein [Ophiocordyceps camponoti-floridani]|uniref:GTPase-activating protein GYP5 n=1 Tax=Ophiocordyceps camponoti-floridani TaxID=2030778 RepID=A0A8H4VAX1_9HYPO|nr:GTPase activating protein [Ophiocordyceps camponoti-floridani]
MEDPKPSRPAGDEESLAAEANHDTAFEHESFEDAVDVPAHVVPVDVHTADTVSVRSLTKRAVAVTQSPASDESDDTEASVVDDKEEVEEKDASDEKDGVDNVRHRSDGEKDGVDDKDDTNRAAQKPVPDARSEVPIPPQSQARPPSRHQSPAHSSRISSTANLDNVNLDDEAAIKHQEPPSPVPKEQPSKKLSLGSLAGALPSMPWNPPNDTSSKGSGPPLTAGTSSQPPAPTRKLTSPFSWLSRNTTSKDKESQPSPPAQTSPRRNTASSVATLMSNPEMMLSRLEEDKDGGRRGSNRESLKDRFKALRLREESGMSTPAADGDKAGGALGLVNQDDETVAGEMPPPSPVPGPNIGLAPGTMSGINAGPSAMPDTRVDWDLWQSVVYEGPAAVARSSAEELNRAIATGIPNAIRGVVWQVLAQSKSDGLEVVYRELVARGTEKDRDRHSNSTTTSSISNASLSAHSGDAPTSSASSVHSEQSGATGEKGSDAVVRPTAISPEERKKKTKENAAALQKLEKTIRRDLGARTSYSKYAAASGLQDGLFGVCKAYALYDEGVGYAQGMNFLIMPLLFNMPEQEAFCLLVRLMNQYHLRELFIQDMPGLHMHLYQFERLLEDTEPALYCHLHRRGISSHLYATQWFLTLFAYRFPLQLVLRIYDLIFSEGLSAILRFGIVLMQKNAATLLALSDMQQLTTHLKDKLFDVYIDKDPSQGSILENGFFGSSTASQDKEVYRADQLVRDACEVKITPELLKAYTSEWEEKTRAERGREAELQDLSQANQSYAAQVRKLEERVEACDREQTALATEMVHTKVENEELRDENESLKGQVRELKVVIEKQPADIEASWKLERDDLMKRNGHVHEENQRLEKELAELEEELVQTKMHYAELHSQHETLNRKWADLKRQFA